MPITLDDIAELRARVAETRRQLEEEEAALKVLERMLEREQGSKNAGFQRAWKSKTKEIQQISLDDLELDFSEEQPETLVDSVKQVIPIFEGREFTVPLVEKALKAQGKVIDADNPRTRLSTVLSRLAKSGYITRTFKGKGSVPNRFKVNRDEEESDDMLSI